MHILLKEKLLKSKQKRLKTKKRKQFKALKPLNIEKELESIKGLFGKKMRTDKIKNEIEKIKKWEEKAERKNLI